MPDEQLPFSVEEWNASGSFVRVVARADNLIVARAAFEAAAHQYPDALVRLRNRTLVMEEHKPGEPHGDTMPVFGTTPHSSRPRRRKKPPG